MEKLLIVSAFKVDVAQGQNIDGTDKPPVTRHYQPGVVVEITDVPEGQSADDWIAKDLAKAA